MAKAVEVLCADNACLNIRWDIRADKIYLIRTGHPQWEGEVDLGELEQFVQVARSGAIDYIIEGVQRYRDGTRVQD